VIYLIDANVLITAHNTYYPVDRVPEFWAWLLHQAEVGTIKMPIEVFEEVMEGSGDEEKDKLLAWLKGEGVKDALVLPGDVDIDLVQHVIETAYAADLNDVELERVGRDPFLIAHALAAPAARTVVSNEVSKNSQRRGGRKIPDACRDVGAACCNTFAMLRALDWRTGWNS